MFLSPAAIFVNVSVWWLVLVSVECLKHSLDVPNVIWHQKPSSTCVTALARRSFFLLMTLSLLGTRRFHTQFTQVFFTAGNSLYGSQIRADSSASNLRHFGLRTSLNGGLMTSSIIVIFQRGFFFGSLVISRLIFKKPKASDLRREYQGSKGLWNIRFKNLKLKARRMLKILLKSGCLSKCIGFYFSDSRETKMI